MSPLLEWRMWRQLRGAFSIDRFVFVPKLPEMSTFSFDQFDDMQEALDTCTGVKVFLEQGGDHTLHDLANLEDEDVVLILGNTEFGNSDYIKSEDLSVSIKSDNTDLYGINAAAIALAYRYGQ